MALEQAGTSGPRPSTTGTVRRSKANRRPGAGRAGQSRAAARREGGPCDGQRRVPIKPVVANGSRHARGLHRRQEGNVCRRGLNYTGCLSSASLRASSLTAANVVQGGHLLRTEVGVPGTGSPRNWRVLPSCPGSGLPSAVWIPLGCLAGCNLAVTPAWTWTGLDVLMDACTCLFAVRTFPVGLYLLRGSVVPSDLPLGRCA